MAWGARNLISTQDFEDAARALGVVNCVEIKILRRVRRHRRDAADGVTPPMAWRCRFLAARPSQDDRVIAEK